MSTRKYEILIVVVVLFLLAALVGCKDEVEASDYKTKFINGIACKEFGSGWQPIASFCPKCGEFSPWSNNCSQCGTENFKGDYRYVCPNDHKTYSSDPYCRNCGGKTTLKNIDPEPDEPAEGSILIENDKGDFVWFNPEPNEPLIEIDPNSELVTSLNLLYDPNFYEPKDTSGLVIDDSWTYTNTNLFDPNATVAISSYYCSYCDKDLGRLAEYATYHICGEKEIPLFERFLQSIPTWPDYIELEKRLVITYQFPESYSCEYNKVTDKYEIVKAHKTNTWPKGTKIYFKD